MLSHPLPCPNPVVRKGEMGGRGRGLESVRSEKFAINSEGQVIAYIMLCNVEPIDIDIYIRDLGEGSVGAAQACPPLSLFC